MNVLRSRAALAVIGANAAVVVCLLGVLPLWLDELLQLAGTHPGASLGEVIQYVPRNPGGVPLGYIVQHFVLVFTGVSTWAARLPAAAFGMGACAAVAVLAGRTGVKRMWLAAAILAVLPLTLRYSTEARPYSQAVFLSIVIVILFLRLADQLTAARFAAYAAVLLAAVYTQPFTVLTAVAAFGWAFLTRRFRLAAWSGAAVIVAAAAIVPWIVYSRAAWNTTIATSEFQFVWTARTPLMLLREISGGGYVASIALLILAGLALRSNVLTREMKLLLALLVAVPLAGGLVADAVFGYFIAVRQFLWVLPPLALLAAAGTTSAGRLGFVLAIVLAAACVYKNVRYFSEPKEDWTVAVQAIRTEMAAGPACFIAAPRDADIVYEFLEPSLKRAACGDGPWPGRVIAAVTPHTTASQKRQLLDTAAKAGYAPAQETMAGGTRVVVLVRRG